MIHNVTSKLGCVLCCLRYCMWKITEIIRRSWHLTIPPSSFVYASDQHSGYRYQQAQITLIQLVTEKRTTWASIPKRAGLFLSFAYTF